MSRYLITGTNKGIGLELVTQLLTHPATTISQIFAVTRRPEPSITTLAKSHPDRLINIVIPSYTSPSDLTTAVSEVTSHLKQAGGKTGIDVLVNNAGMMPYTGGSGKFWDLEPKQLNDTVQANIVGALMVTTAFLDLLRAGTEKKIVNISTTLGSISLAKNYSFAPTHSYKITKAGFNMLTKQMAMDLEGEGFTVIALSPGWLKTELGGGDMADLPVDVGVSAVKDVIFKVGPGDSGTMQNILVPGWEKAEGPNQYDGKQPPW